MVSINHSLFTVFFVAFEWKDLPQCFWITAVKGFCKLKLHTTKWFNKVYFTVFAYLARIPDGIKHGPSSTLSSDPSFLSCLSFFSVWSCTFFFGLLLLMLKMGYFSKSSSNKDAFLSLRSFLLFLVELFFLLSLESRLDLLLLFSSLSDE